jgi:regulator of replication initiation timing
VSIHRCAQLETQLTTLQSEASGARAQLTSLVKAQDLLHAETDKRLAAAKAAAAAEREALTSRNAAKIKKLQETAKEQVRWGEGGQTLVWGVMGRGWDGLGGWAEGSSRGGSCSAAGGADEQECSPYQQKPTE